jgi:hypothetical protein
MPVFDLVRLSIEPTGAYGVLLDNGHPFAVTLERTYPQADGGPETVKIPPGSYTCDRKWFIRGGYYTYEIEGVVGHDQLLFHRGTLEEHSDGCVLVGKTFNDIGIDRTSRSGVDGLSDFLLRTKGVQQIDLRISEWKAQ